MDLLSHRIASAIFLLWGAVAVVAVIATFTLVARRDILDEPESRAPTVVATQTAEPSRPTGVPDDASLITEDTVIGSTSPGTASEPAHIFYWLTCDDQLLTISTTQETVYAEVDCVQYWLVHEVIRPYQGQPVKIEITTGPQGTLELDATNAGPARFDVDAVWVRPQ